MNKDQRMCIRLSEEDISAIDSAMGKMCARYAIPKKTRTAALMEAIRYYNEQNRP